MLFFLATIFAFGQTVMAAVPSIQVTPREISPGGIIVISSLEPIFKDELSKNEITFSGSTDMVIPFLVSQDKKAITVNVPDTTKTGTVKVVIDGQEKGTFPLSLISCAGEKAFYWVFWLTFIILVIMLLIIAFSLRRPGWSLGDALSEQARSADDKPLVDSNSKPVLINSSSRLIAFIGLCGILALDLGIGTSIYWKLFLGQDIPNLEGVGWFLFGQASLFAPYIVNQVRSAFKQ